MNDKSELSLIGSVLTSQVFWRMLSDEINKNGFLNFGNDSE